MSGETEDNISGWTTDTLRADLQRQLDTLREIFEQRINAEHDAMITAMDVAEKAVVKAEVSAEKRFESVNEFRGQLADQVATFMSRQEATVRIDALAEKLDAEALRTQQRFNELELRLTSG
jgi:hypothetical protein